LAVSAFFSGAAETTASVQINKIAAVNQIVVFNFSTVFLPLLFFS